MSNRVQLEAICARLTYLMGGHLQMYPGVSCHLFLDEENRQSRIDEHLVELLLFRLPPMEFLMQANISLVDLKIYVQRSEQSYYQFLRYH
uniref:FERM domain-containing protein n=1 Tax=Caenorhabditis tropicalis TaxID=1561998 RepID=A0A1I7URN7_9PELO